jgi:hypothetical protein
MVKSPQTILRMLKAGKITVKVHAFEGTSKHLSGYCYPPEFSVAHIKHHLPIKWRVSTLIHECLHMLNPQTKEEVILAVEKEVFMKLSKSQYKKLVEFVT